MASDVIELARGGDRLVDLDPTPVFGQRTSWNRCGTSCSRSPRRRGSRSTSEAARATDFRIGHPVALLRVLLNLTTNALKFTSEGRVEVHGATGWRGTRVEFQRP